MFEGHPYYALVLAFYQCVSYVLNSTEIALMGLDQNPTCRLLYMICHSTANGATGEHQVCALGARRASSVCVCVQVNRNGIIPSPPQPTPSLR